MDGEHTNNNKKERTRASATATNRCDARYTWDAAIGQGYCGAGGGGRRGGKEVGDGRSYRDANKTIISSEGNGSKKKGGEAIE